MQYTCAFDILLKKKSVPVFGALYSGVQHIQLGSMAYMQPDQQQLKYC